MSKALANKNRLGAERIVSVSILRAGAILLVVLAHSVHGFTGGWIYNFSSQSRLLSYLTRFIYSFHMSLFVFISGYLFFYFKSEIKKYDNFEKFVKDKSKRLLAPYFIVGLLFMVPIRIILGLYKLSQLPFILKYQILLVENPGHLWFVFMLFNLFMVFYLGYDWVVKHKYLVFTFLIILLLFSSYFPVDFQIRNSLFYAFFFYLGLWFRKNQSLFADKFKRYYLGLFVFVISAQGILVWLFLNNLEPTTPFLAFIFLLTGILGIILAGLTVEILGKAIYKKFPKEVKFLDKNAFTIYLIHEPIIFILLNFLPKTMNPYLVTITVFVPALSISCIAAYFINLNKPLRIALGAKS